MDTNVQLQNIVRLTQRSVELGKTDSELAIYPVAGHGFEEPPNWTDEVPTHSRAYPDVQGAGAESEVNRQHGP